MSIVQNFPLPGGETAPPSVAWNHAATSETPDFESAILLRSKVLPIFDQANSWRGLVVALCEQGFGISIRNGRLWLTQIEDKHRICTARFLGMPLASLSKRLGKPCILAVGNGNGEFMI